MEIETIRRRTQNHYNTSVSVAISINKTAKKVIRKRDTGKDKLCYITCKSMPSISH